MPRLLLAAILCFSFVRAHAQISTPTPAPNLIYNGSFDQFYPRDNLWDGVDSDGYLCGERMAVPALTESGAVSDVAMPISVSVADINGDGLPDILVADPTGYFRAYINSGTKTEPKFTHCEMIPIFFSRSGLHAMDETRYLRSVPKLCLYDWNNRGLFDMIVGDYAGEVFFFPNAGTRTAPDFRQPLDLNSALLRTSKNGALWGNLFAPAAADWNGDGKTDLLIGEGSYSANAIHLFLNTSQGSNPAFSEDSRYYLAYGEGREQLVPTVVDYNGDGNPDLLVGDRKGTIGVYLNHAGWKPGDVLKMDSLISFGRTDSLGGSISPCAADMNGDGLFDLVIGKNNGRIALALNKGTKEQPKFDPPEEIRGVDLWKRNINIPNGWSVDYGLERGNVNAYISCVSAAEDKDAAPPVGTHVLKAGYFPSQNRVFKAPNINLPGLGTGADRFSPAGGWHAFDASVAGFRLPTQTFVLRKIFTTQLKVGVNYELSFKVKGAGIVRDAKWTIAYFGHKENAPAKIQRGERGSATITRDESTEDLGESDSFSVGTSWGSVTHDFQCRFKEKYTKELDKTTAAFFEIRFSLAPYDSVLYLDDVQLVEKS